MICPEPQIGEFRKGDSDCDNRELIVTQPADCRYKFFLYRENDNAVQLIFTDST